MTAVIKLKAVEVAHAIRRYALTSSQSTAVVIASSNAGAWHFCRGYIQCHGKSITESITLQLCILSHKM